MRLIRSVSEITVVCISYRDFVKRDIAVLILQHRVHRKRFIVLAVQQASPERN